MLNWKEGYEVLEWYLTLSTIPSLSSSLSMTSTRPSPSVSTFLPFHHQAKMVIRKISHQDTSKTCWKVSHNALLRNSHDYSVTGAIVTLWFSVYGKSIPKLHCGILAILLNTIGRCSIAQHSRKAGTTRVSCFFVCSWHAQHNTNNFAAAFWLGKMNTSHDDI